MSTIYTIGHSRHGWETFAGLLQGAKITALADLRTRPYSRFPQFNRPALQAQLKTDGIAYHYLGEPLGGKSGDGGVVDYEATAKTASFRAALAELEEIAGTDRLAILCSEHEPLNCHRFLLVGRRLAERGNTVEHILRDGKIECHTDTEARLLKVTRNAQRDLLRGRGEGLDRAYRAQENALMRKNR